MKFSELNLHPALAATLAARGYETATPVQAAVLDPACAGRDLLVSSETGSGKTVAFGGALAETLLAPAAEDGTFSKPKPGPNPVALVIVPTRELAAQVREELSWLLQRTGLRLAAFTGGTPVGGDLRNLQRGVDLVIGTPGRLVDLLRRERLTLTDLRVVVLDEADEMLDLGFREDLETILKTAPPTRRTLLLSATLPTEIRAMARKFQRDALAVDPRKNADGTGGAAKGAAAHSDITYVAHLIAGGDRLAAVVNVLRAAGNPRAIVFCTTREGVAMMHAALVARGFSAVAISGDRAQVERDRALEQLRRGEVQVLVATNVAARGLHLPDVDLIVHADLPLNAESLTHRSGRTGRAGRKGTAVVIARVVERFKAERLLASAHVKPVWTPAPSAKAIATAALEQLLQELVSETAPDDSGADELLKRLDAQLDLPALVRKLLAREVARLPAGEPLAKVPMPAPGSRSDARDDARSFQGRSSDSGNAHSPRSRAELSRDGVVFRVNIGENEKADPRWLLPLICRRGGVTRREVGAIRIGARETLFEIAGNAAREFSAAAAEIDPRARHVIIERADAPAVGAAGSATAAARVTSATSATSAQSNGPHATYARKTYDKPTQERPTHPRPAHPPAATPRPAHPQTATPRPAHPQATTPRPAHPQAAHPRPAHPLPAHPQAAYPRPAHPRPGYPQAAHPRPAHPHAAPRPAHARPAPHQGPPKHHAKGPGKHTGKHPGKSGT